MLPYVCIYSNLNQKSRVRKSAHLMHTALAILVPLVTLILGAFLGLWYSVWMQRPKLDLHGAGGSGSKGMICHTVRLSNQPAFLGVHFKETTILGRMLWGDHRLGYPIERHAARDCMAWLLNPRTKQPEISVSLALDGTYANNIVPVVAPYQAVNVMLIGRMEMEPSRYFIWQADGMGGAKTPTEDLKLSGERDFILRVMYNNNYKQDFKVEVRPRLDGHFSVVARR